MSFPGDMSTQSGKAPQVMRKYGVMLAHVTNITDPENLNRVKCKPVSADPDVAETDWCYYLAPTAGKGYGQFAFPNVGDYALVGYMGGDVHHPIIFGFYWANDNTPPYKIQDGKNTVQSIKTPSGVEIKMDDEKDKQKLTLTTPSGAVISVDDENKLISVHGKDTDSQLSISWEKGEITLAAKQKLTLSAGETKLVLDSKGNAELTASKDISISGTGIKADAKNAFKAHGVSVDIAADGTFNAKSSGTLAIKGSLVQIN